MKTEWRKEEKSLYLQAKKPALIDVPTMRFFAIEGQGNPNAEPFAQCTQALYTMAYSVRMMHKSGFIPEGFAEYTVYPLEGVWDLSGPWDHSHPLNKDDLIYTLMIRQPAFVTEEVFGRALVAAKKKGDSPELDAVRMMDYTEGLCEQMMHAGPYDDEPESFAQMDRFATENGLVRTATRHREIYLSDPRRAVPETMKTVLRYEVTQA